MAIKKECRRGFTNRWRGQTISSPVVFMPGTMQDKIFEQSRQRHLLTVGFLTTLKKNFDKKTAFRLAAESLSFYMLYYYQEIFKGTMPGSQQRFNAFRKHYEQYANKSTYLHIVTSTPTTLKVQYDRCPLTEVMKVYDLSEFSSAFCLSDPAFTKKLLPEVTFHRCCTIAQGARCCDQAWVYKRVKALKKNKQTKEEKK